MPTKHTTEILTAAVLGFEEQKRRIDLQIAEIRQMLDGGGGKPTASAPEPTKRKRRKMSAAGRKAISEATKKRWAAFHAAKQAAKPAVAKRHAAKKAVARKTAKAPVKMARKTAAKNANVPVQAGTQPTA